MKKMYRGLLLTIWGVGLSSLSRGQCFSSPISFSSSSESRIVVADFNTDGNHDLAIYSNGVIAMSSGNGSGNFSTSTYSVVNGFSQRYAVGDFNGDGKPDLVGAGSDTISVVLNDGSQFRKAINTPFYFDNSHNPSAIVVGDFNNDNKLDVATISPFSKRLSLLLGNGLGGFITTTSYSLGSRSNLPIALVTGDFNADGKLDLVTANTYATGESEIAILLSDGNGSFSPVSTISTSSASFVSLVSTDFNGDNKPDLAFALSSPFTKGVSILLGQGDGSFNGGGSINLGVGLVNELFVGDFNSDGKPDLAAPNSSLQSIDVRLGTGDGKFGTSTFFSTGNTPLSLAVGDFNKDGRSDLAVAGRNSSTSQPLSTILLNCATPPAATDLTLTTPAYDCNTGQLTLSTSGGNGQLIEYRIAGLRDWLSSNVFTIPTYQRTGTTFTLEARQSGQAVSLPFATACQSTTPTPPTPPTPPVPPTPPTGTGLSLAAPAYDCSSGQLQLSTTGGNGQLVEYRIAGLRDWSAGNSFTIPTYQRTGTNFILEARQSGQVVSLAFTSACPTTTPTPPVTPFTPPAGTPLTVSGQPLNCQTGVLQLVAAGGDGTAIAYKVPGLGDYTASPSFTVPTYQRSGTNFTLYARQSGREVTATYTATCPVGTRLASPETVSAFDVVVYPNPVGEQFTVGVSGAAGQAVRFQLTNLAGQTVVEQRAQVMSDQHTETLRLPASGAGLYLLRVSTNGQSRTVKVLKP